ncbi:hypothetical protein C8T65DRAFT_833212 [Cerioporus squamosus]|nr:hypothetical protein C8T65DRAFT_833212 [Cerioporus squamosus]
MATVRALAISEIAREIVEQAHALPALERRFVLARLAQVSSIFHDRTTRLLWVDLPRIEPLFKLLSNCVSISAMFGGGYGVAQSSYSLVRDASYRGISAIVSQRFSGIRRPTWVLGRRDIITATPFLAVTIRPLFVLEGLRELSINVVNRPVFDDDIALLAGGLPHLSHLELKFHMEQMGPTARSLLTLAQGCPSLQTLHLGGLFITETDEANAETYPFVRNRLHVLNIADLRCEGEIHAAMIIDVLFPFLDVNACRRRADKGRWRNLGQWCEVVDRLEAFHTDRK